MRCYSNLLAVLGVVVLSTLAARGLERTEKDGALPHLSGVPPACEYSSGDDCERSRELCVKSCSKYREACDRSNPNDPQYCIDQDNRCSTACNDAWKRCSEKPSEK